MCHSISREIAKPQSPSRSSVTASGDSHRPVPEEG